jgi:hypothetical protein
LAACFDADINEGFVSDSVKINVEQVFKLISPTTEIKVI